ncbi:MAG: hypothetical protein ACK4M7_10420, partial [Burkholderiales bacterium]
SKEPISLPEIIYDIAFSIGLINNEEERIESLLDWLKEHTAANDYHHLYRIKQYELSLQLKSLYLKQPNKDLDEEANIVFNCLANALHHYIEQHPIVTRQTLLNIASTLHLLKKYSHMGSKPSSFANWHDSHLGLKIQINALTTLMSLHSLLKEKAAIYLNSEIADYFKLPYYLKQFNVILGQLEKFAPWMPNEEFCTAFIKQLDHFMDLPDSNKHQILAHNQLTFNHLTEDIHLLYQLALTQQDPANLHINCLLLTKLITIDIILLNHQPDFQLKTSLDQLNKHIESLINTNLASYAKKQLFACQIALKEALVVFYESQKKIKPSSTNIFQERINHLKKQITDLTHKKNAPLLTPPIAIF